MSNSESTTATGVDGFDDSKADIRRYAMLIPDQIVEGSSMSLGEEDADDDASLLADFVSAWESTTGPVACPADPKPSDSVLSEAEELDEKHQKQPDGVTEAQRIVQEYLQRSKTIEDQGTTNVCPLNTAKKELPVTPNNRDSTCTHTVTDDGQFTVDLEKRPELEVRLLHHDPEGVAQAQLQGLEMVQTGHYTPGAMIRCERPGCTNVLRDLEALKCHLHIHNIGDMTDAISISYGHCQRAKELGHSSESSPLNKFSRKVRDRSRSIMDLDASSGGSCDPIRKVYAKDPCSSSRSRKAGAVDAPHTRTKLPDPLTPQTRGRRRNRSTIRGGLDEAGYHDTIAMVLSRPPSPVQGAQEALGSDMNLPVNTSGVLSPSPSVSPTLGEKELPRATSPKRFSPGRALSPIRDGLRRCFHSDA